MHRPGMNLRMCGSAVLCICNPISQFRETGKDEKVMKVGRGSEVHRLENIVD